MGIDLPSFRIKIGLFNLSIRRSRKRYIHTDSVGTTTMALFYLTIFAVLTTTHISLSQPSYHTPQYIDTATSNSSTIYSYFSYLDLLDLESILQYNQIPLFKVTPQTIDYQSALLFNKTTVPLYVNSITLIENPLFLRFIGNKATHSYNGNVSKTERKQPKYPCIICDKSVTARSKAVSCDSCQKWTHVNCTSSLSLEQYNTLQESQTEFDFLCYKCSLGTLPFDGEHSLD